MFCDPCLQEVPYPDFLNHMIHHINQSERRIMTAINDLQATLDGAGQQLTDLAATIGTDATTIEGQIGTTVDLTAFNNGLSAVADAVNTLSALANPTPPAPAP